ncbi:MAG: adenylyltransferase/cytidyltransferase family protein [Deltaproteobacteria bacterium]|nr:adenylyltransferase/cytidyltransferase family protein [Deltaproteobacteria bacterium]
MTSAAARSKISTLDVLATRVARARRAGKSIVFTNGCFDLLHIGHVRSLEEAARLGDRLVVAVNRDASVRRAKGRNRPVLPAAERIELVASLGCVDWVVGFTADTPIRVIEKVRPDVLAKGGDWALDEIVGRQLVESWGGRVVRLRRVPGRRSTDLIELIRNEPARRKR